MKHPAEVLRELLGRPGGVFAFGVSNAFDAILAVMAGHEAIYSGGYAASAMRGFPDIGQVTATEMLQHHQYITDTVKQTPCIGDADDGYGDAKNVRRTIYDLLTKTRLAAIHLEDQVGPKRCGHIAGKGVLSLDEAVGKIRAAVKVREELSSPVVLIARTDAAGAAGSNPDERFGCDIQAAAERAAAYAAAGADGVWPELPDENADSLEEFVEEFRRRWRSPETFVAVNISMSFSWTHPNMLTSRKIRELGVKLPFSTYPSLREEAMAVLAAAYRFRADYIDAVKRTLERSRNTPVEKIMDVLGVKWWQDFEREFIPGADERLRKSQGHK